MLTSVWLLLMMMMRVANSYTLASTRSSSRDHDEHLLGVLLDGGVDVAAVDDDSGGGEQLYPGLHKVFITMTTMSTFFQSFLVILLLVMLECSLLYLMTMKSSDYLARYVLLVLPIICSAVNYSHPSTLWPWSTSSYNDKQYHQCHYHCYHSCQPIILSTSSLTNNSLHCESFIAKRLGLSDSPILFSWERKDQSEK